MPTVLVVDDDCGMRETLTLILRRKWQVLLAETAERGLELLQRHSVDVVLLDVMLPGELNGLDALVRIKEEWPTVEVIMITVLKDLDLAKEALRRGAFFFVGKDFEYEVISVLVLRAYEHVVASRREHAWAQQRRLTELRLSWVLDKVREGLPS